MKAIVQGHIIADSEDIVDDGGYQYFPPSAVRTELLEKTARTESDLKCPHGVQFYDVIVEGMRYRRAAWCYESPKPNKKAIAWRYGFWNEVEVA